MVKAYVDFGTYIRFILMRDSTLIQYTEFDYDQDTLSRLFALMSDVGISEVTYCMPTYFSHELLMNSVALDHTTLAVTDGYFCISLEDLQALKHLSKTLKIKTTNITERRFMCDSDGVYVFDYNNLCNVYTFANGNLMEFDIQVDSQVEALVEHYCAKYNLHTDYNFVSSSDLSLLMQTFDNIFSISGDDVLNSLTFMARLCTAKSRNIDEYLSSKFVLQGIVSDMEESTEDAVKDLDERESTGADSEPTDEESDDFMSSMQGKHVKRVSRKAGTLASDQEGEESSPSSPNKSQKGKFGLVFACIVAGMVLLNAAVFVLKAKQKQDYNDRYAEFVSKTEDLNNLESKYTVVSSQTTTEAGNQTFNFLKKTNLLKSETIKLLSFKIEGSNVEVTVSAKSEDAFWKFYDKISAKYNISNVTDGNSGEEKNVFVMNLIL